RHTRFSRDWSSDVCSSDLVSAVTAAMSSAESGSLFCARMMMIGGPTWDSLLLGGTVMMFVVSGSKVDGHSTSMNASFNARDTHEIGRAPCREGADTSPAAA